MYLVTSDKFGQLEEMHLRNVSHGPPTGKGYMTRVKYTMYRLISVKGMLMIASCLAGNLGNIRGVAAHTAKTIIPIHSESCLNTDYKRNQQAHDRSRFSCSKTRRKCFLSFGKGYPNRRHPRPQQLLIHRITRKCRSNLILKLYKRQIRPIRHHAHLLKARKSLKNIIQLYTVHARGNLLNEEGLVGKLQCVSSDVSRGSSGRCYQCCGGSSSQLQATLLQSQARLTGLLSLILFAHADVLRIDARRKAGEADVQRLVPKSYPL